MHTPDPKLTELLVSPGMGPRLALLCADALMSLRALHCTAPSMAMVSVLVRPILLICLGLSLTQRISGSRTQEALIFPRVVALVTLRVRLPLCYAAQATVSGSVVVFQISSSALLRGSGAAFSFQPGFPTKAEGDLRSGELHPGHPPQSSRPGLRYALPAYGDRGEVGVGSAHATSLSRGSQACGGAFMGGEAALDFRYALD